MVTAEYNEDRTELIRVPRDVSGVFTIPDGVIKISKEAFLGCYELTSIVIPSGVTEIGEWAFFGCYKLTSIVIPSSVTKIGEGAFAGCEALTSIVIPDSVTEIGKWAFCNCEALTSIVIPSGVTEIGEGAFFNCKSLTSIVIPDSVTKIGKLAFCNCKALTSIVIPSGVTEIGEGAFFGCYELTSIVIPSGVTKIGKLAFADCEALTSIVIPSGVTEIGELAFADCEALTSIVIPSGVTEIGEGAFFKCKSLTSITIPDSVTEIGEQAFADCEALTSIVIPDSVTKIGKLAFCNCKALTSIVIPSGVTEIGEVAFFNCKSLTSVYFHGAKMDLKITLNLDAKTSIYYYSNETPAEKGNYWRYVDGIPMIWNTSVEQEAAKSREEIESLRAKLQTEEEQNKLLNKKNERIKQEMAFRLSQQSICKATQYGVEIEMTGITRQQASGVIAKYFKTTAIAIDRKTQAGSYTEYEIPDTNGQTWQIVRDSSIPAIKADVSANEDEYKVELITPIWHYENMNTITNIAELLKNAGAIIPETGTGIHVHLDGYYLEQDPANIKKLVNFVRRYEKGLFDGLKVQPSRQLHYCKKLDDTFVVKLNKLSSKKLTSDNIREVYYENYEKHPKQYKHPDVRESRVWSAYGRDEHYNDMRYFGLNLHNCLTTARNAKKTVEFRYFNSSLNPEEIKSDIQLALGIYSYAICADTVCIKSKGDYSFKNLLKTCLGQTEFPLKNNGRVKNEVMLPIGFWGE